MRGDHDHASCRTPLTHRTESDKTGRLMNDRRRRPPPGTDPGLPGCVASDAQPDPRTLRNSVRPATCTVVRKVALAATVSKARAARSAASLSWMRVESPLESM